MGMGSDKQHDRHLPKRMRFKHGAYYRVVRNRWTPLGKHYGEALREWARLEAVPEVAATIGDALSAYLIDELGGLKPTTQAEYRRMSGTLRAWCGTQRLDDLQSSDVAGYLRRRSAKVQGNREMALLSSVYAYAMAMGWANANPCRGVRRNRERARTRLPTAAELSACTLAARPMLRAMIEFTLATALRAADLVALDIAALDTSGIAVQTSKTGAALVFEWTDELRAILAPAIGRRQLGPVFLTVRGRRWTTSGLDTMWGRLRAKVGIADLHWHDLRAWALTEIDRQRGRDAAAAFAAHKSKATTDVYLRDRSATVLVPLGVRAALKNARQSVHRETADSPESA